VQDVVSAAVAVVSAVAGVVATQMFNARNEERKRRRSELENFWRPLNDAIANSSLSFDLQTTLRDRLIADLKERGTWPQDVTLIPEALAAAYPNMNDDQRDAHAYLRAITFGWMRDANDRIVQLLQQYPQCSFQLSGTRDLRQHLMLWLTKAKREEPKPEVCLVYVGVKEGVPFPIGAEREVRGFLEKYRI
jgi:hypothetical protein